MNKRFSDPVTSMHRGRLNSLKLSAAWDSGVNIGETLADIISINFYVEF